MKKHSTLKTLLGIASIGLVSLGIIEAGKIAEEEKNGDFHTEFPDKADEITEILKNIKKEKLNEKGENQNG